MFWSAEPNLATSGDTGAILHNFNPYRFEMQLPVNPTLKRKRGPENYIETMVVTVRMGFTPLESFR